jgi:methanogenic corrinoid protein MtbC1
MDFQHMPETASAEPLRYPGESSVQTFQSQLKEITQSLTSRMTSSPDFRRLIGPNSIMEVETAIRNYLMTLQSVYLLSDFSIMKSILPWVYRSYMSHGFHQEYFLRNLECTREEFRFRFPEPAAGEFCSCIEWMLNHHEDNLEKSSIPLESYIASSEGTDSEITQRRDILQALLNNQYDVLTALLEKSESQKGISTYDSDVRPVMYEIGQLWELNRISVTEEHAASAMVTDYLVRNAPRDSVTAKRRILVTPTVNEYHEIGAQMVANAFRDKGWFVRYLGAGTPEEAILDTIETFRPDAAALSIGLITRVGALTSMVSAIQNRFPDLAIVVGGKFIDENPGVAAKLNVHSLSQGLKDLPDYVESILSGSL